TPGVIAAVAITLSTVPWPPPGGAIGSVLGATAVFYWSFRRPELFPIWVPLVLGALQDVLSGGPTGLNALLFILIALFARCLKSLVRSSTFPIAWVGFVTSFLLAQLIIWAVASLYFLTIVGSGPVIDRFLLGVVTYPLWHLVLWAVDRPLFGRIA
ncbi:MAG: rod shape-determining protein MreD, partial [Pirellulales bacterium]|nr:rod shape-determining protein MreD [Pirellulales bacterium]